MHHAAIISFVIVETSKGFAALAAGAYCEP
jgi:hypothetical protein